MLLCLPKQITNKHSIFGQLLYIYLGNYYFSHSTTEKFLLQFMILIVSNNK